MMMILIFIRLRLVSIILLFVFYFDDYLKTMDDYIVFEAHNPIHTIFVSFLTEDAPTASNQSQPFIACSLIVYIF